MTLWSVCPSQRLVNRADQLFQFINIVHFTFIWETHCCIHICTVSTCLASVSCHHQWRWPLELCDWHGVVIIGTLWYATLNMTVVWRCEIVRSFPDMLGIYYTGRRSPTDSHTISTWKAEEALCQIGTWDVKMNHFTVGLEEALCNDNRQTNQLTQMSDTTIDHTTINRLAETYAHTRPMH